MSLFDDLSKKISHTGQSLVNKANEIADVTKLNYQIGEEEKSLAALYQQLGQAYYGQAEKAQLESCCQAIKEKLAYIASLRAQEATARNLRLCPNCSAVCELSQPYCGVCGTALPRVAAPGTKFCPGCGQQIAADCIFCPSCGAHT